MNHTETYMLRKQYEGGSIISLSTSRFRSVLSFLKIWAICIAVFSLSSAPLVAHSADRLPSQDKKPKSSLSARSPSTKKQAVKVRTSPVILDRKELFSVQGFGALSPEDRAKAIGKRILEIAEDMTVRSDSIDSVDADISTDVVAGDHIIMSVTEKDAVAAGRTRQDLASGYAEIIRSAIEQYRVNYSRKSILSGIIYCSIATVVLIAILVLISKFFRKLNNLIETRYKDRIHAIHVKSVEVVQAQRVRAFVEGAISIVRLVIFAMVVYSYVHIVLSFFPWTRPFANQVLGYLLIPLRVIGESIISHIPNLLFITVLVVITRYILKFMHIFFMQVDRGAVKITGFYPEWARPTDKLFSLLIIAFVAVVAFPYIPGSDSPAFKAVSIFIGVLLSLGAQSAVSNIIGGLVVIYRRAFKIGDRIRIGEIYGDVAEIRLQQIRILTVKNENVIVPNSIILNSHIINYSSLAREKGLILHTAVTIGYDAAWRQVHALLLMAAERTDGLLKEPPPFVLQTSLDDFYVRYELNVYTDEPNNMAQLYSDLHRNIQDCFNEYGVQIMSPHYIADPSDAKIVPKNKWYAPPAKEDLH